MSKDKLTKELSLREKLQAISNEIEYYCYRLGTISEACNVLGLSVFAPLEEIKRNLLLGSKDIISALNDDTDKQWKLTQKAHGDTLGALLNSTKKEDK